MAAPGAPPEQSKPHNDDREGSSEELRNRIYLVIFGTNTPAGRAFDLGLLIVIVLSILTVMFESVQSYKIRFGTPLRYIEWIFTALFTVEYVARIYSAKQRLRYIFSFFGIIDLLSLLPTYYGFFAGAGHSLVVLRVLRLLRIFRILKIVRMLGAATDLLNALRASIPKITVFIGAVLTVVVIIGAAMHLIEPEESGFTSIPRSMYWAIVTLTTVGYGDIAPTTVPGQALSATLMILGYGIIAVPTGIVSAELVQAQADGESIHCPACGAHGHADDANYCRVCGAELL